MIWGLVFAYLEGRSITEILAAILSSSYILASGVTKSVGKWIMNEYGISEFWMPFTTGVIFIIPLCIAVWLIDRSPDPDQSDKMLRHRREPMNVEDRKKVLRTISPGIVLLTSVLFLLTGIRDLRDNFAAELWMTMGYGQSASIFTKTEIIITAIVIGLMMIFVLIKNNHKALARILQFMLLGIGLLLVSTVLYQAERLDPFQWMTLSGIRIVYAYVPLGSIVFERITALFKIKSNAGYLIYIADAFSYLGSVFILVFKEIWFPDISFYDYYISIMYGTGLISIALILSSIIYFQLKSFDYETTHEGDLAIVP